jgi:hypothetical protein
MYVIPMDRNPIQQLPQSLVNRIAAGEVIERPASVVKELVDNAIDAGATQIIVEIEDGGRELIRVIDDGCGIPADELPLAFAPHATSKLREDEDLFRIQTMGFRGEALASIGSVSHARILSRVATSDAAYELTNRGGELSDIQAAAGNVGTTIEIRNLFFNTPARRKFLKGTQTEFGHISEMLMRLALAQPEGRPANTPRRVARSVCWRHGPRIFASNASRWRRATPRSGSPASSACPNSPTRRRSINTSTSTADPSATNRSLTPCAKPTAASPSPAATPRRSS